MNSAPAAHTPATVPARAPAPTPGPAFVPGRTPWPAGAPGWPERFPTSARPARQSASVITARVVGGVVTMLAAMPFGYYGLLAFAFGLGLAHVGLLLVALLCGVLTLGWPTAFVLGTHRARRLWPVLLGAAPAVLVLGGLAWLLLAYTTGGVQY